MPLGIPMPESFGESFGRGVQTGSTLFNTMMAPKLQREQQAQAWQQHMNNLAIQKQQEERMQAQLPYLIEQFKQASELHPYQVKNLQSQIRQHNASAKEHEMNANPMAKFKAFQQMMAELGGGNTQPMQQPDQPGNNFNPGMGGQIPIGGMPQQLPSAKQPFGNGEMHPQLAQFIKAATGIDPLAKTQAQKDAEEFKKFKDKEDYKKSQKENNEKTALTPAVQSKLQEEIYNIQKVRPELQYLIDMKPQTATWLGTTNDADYDALTFRVADALVKALDYPRTNESIHKMQDSLRIGGSEKSDNYKKRLERLMADINERESKGIELLGNKKISGSMLKGITKEGKEVFVDPKHEAEFIKAEGRII